MEGVIKHRRGNYLIITYGADAHAHFNSLVCPNGHNCLFREGMSVTFEESVRADGRVIAVNVALNDPFELDEWEESVLMKWHGTFGFANRLCGCEIFCTGYHLHDESLRAVGTHFFHRVEPSQRPGYFQATDIQPIQAVEVEQSVTEE